jgi:hypothetical protein
VEALGKGENHFSPYNFQFLICQTYGPLTQVTALGQNILVINSHSTALELMTERGQIYSSRPVMPFLGGEVGWDRAASFKGPGDDFRETRKIWRQTLEAKKAEKVISFPPSSTHVTKRLVLPTYLVQIPYPV